MWLSTRLGLVSEAALIYTLHRQAYADFHSLDLNKVLKSRGNPVIHRNLASTLKPAQELL